MDTGTGSRDTGLGRRRGRVKNRMGPEEVLAAEKRWLVEEEAGFVCKNLKTLLLNSLLALGTHRVEGSFVKGLIGEEPGEEEARIIESSRALVSFEASGGQFKGFLTAEAWFVKDAELTIRTNKSQPPIKTRITSQHPFIVSQLQNAHNYLEVGLIQLLDLQRLLGEELCPSSKHSISESLGEDQDELYSNASRNILQEVKYRVEKIGVHIVKAQQQLSWNIDCWGLPLQEITIPNGQFSPPLPLGLMVRLAIENGDLALSIYYLSKVKRLNPQNDSPHGQNPHHVGHSAPVGSGGLHLTANGGPITQPSGSYLGYAFKLPPSPATQNKQLVVEVTEQADTKCKINIYAEILENINKAVQYCNEFVEKAAALETSISISPPR